MSEIGHESRRNEIAAYLLGALEPEEAASLERHLATGCVECRAELRWLQPAVQLLPETVEPVKAPRELRARILAEARSDIEPAARGAAARRRLRSGWRPLAGLAALALVLAAVAGYAIGGGSSGGSGPAMMTVVAGRAPGMTARMVGEGEAGTLHLANVDELPRDKVLEAWVQRAGAVSPVRALFVPDREGRAMTTIPDLRGVDAVMVTAEPRGGSDTPTSTPMVTLEMPRS
jgi:anti-sigma-K factor RskA